MKPRHQNRFARERDARSMPPAADSPVVRSSLTPVEAATKQVEAQATARMGRGWINAPYARCARLERVPPDGVPVLLEVVARP